MTPERKTRIDELVIKLKHCQAECDEMRDEECEQEENCADPEYAVICDENFYMLTDAIHNIEETIYQLEKIEE